jgi:hypothetical protein
VSSYFNHPNVSNSDLKSLRDMFYGIVRDYPVMAFLFGSLVDAMLTEEHLVNYTDRTLFNNGKHVLIDAVTFKLAQRLAERLRKDPVISLLLKHMTGQYEVYRTLEFEYEGDLYHIPARVKFDGYCKLTREDSVDYKTTTCTTQRQFEESIYYFDYDQQGAWYMDVGRTNRHWIIGISKVNKKIFKYAIDRTTPVYKSGYIKYTKWSFMWLTLIENTYEYLRLQRSNPLHSAQCA